MTHHEFERTFASSSMTNPTSVKTEHRPHRKRQREEAWTANEKQTKSTTLPSFQFFRPQNDINERVPVDLVASIPVCVAPNTTLASCFLPQLQRLAIDIFGKRRPMEDKTRKRRSSEDEETDGYQSSQQQASGGRSGANNYDTSHLQQTGGTRASPSLLYPQNNAAIMNMNQTLSEIQQFLAASQQQ
eukprot:scaffold43683_cov199-Amphora_coffeaeformis.AAC.1